MARIINYDEAEVLSSDAYLIADSSSDGTQKVAVTKLLNSIPAFSGLKEDLDNTRLSTKGINIPYVRESDWINGGVSSSTGAEDFTSTKLIHTSMYAIDADSTYTFTGVKIAGRAYYNYFYDANGNYLGRSNSAIVSGASYVRFCYGFTSSAADTVASYGKANLIADWGCTIIPPTYNILNSAFHSLGTLPTDADLNDYISNGAWQCTSTVDMANGPVNAVSGVLYVCASDSDNVVQIIACVDNHVRTRVKYGGTWLAWVDRIPYGTSVTSNTYSTLGVTNALTLMDGFTFFNASITSAMVSNLPVYGVAQTVIKYSAVAGTQNGGVLIDITRDGQAFFGMQYSSAITWQTIVSTSYVSESIKSNTRQSILFSAFKRFGVIGDSMAAGHLYSDENSSASGYDDKTYSWATYMERYLKNTCYNFSQHGHSPDTFISGILDGVSTGDNSLECALDGNHDVPLYIVALSLNNHNNLPEGSTSDINLFNYTQNANTRYGTTASLIQRLSAYYRTKSIPVHIVMIAPTHWGGYTQRQNHDRSVEVYEYIKSTIEDDGNGLYLIDLWDEPFYDSAFISGNTIQNHYSAMGYNASAMDLLDRLNDLIYANPTKFNRVDQLSTNSYIESYSNPTNWT